ncbi:putative ABC transporter substrate-binding protein [Gordonia rhizosphera NBRC 16068]|uniref:Putative ABC transporter substrate-binding protein n=2 Tax=Gordonia rhizosphera TaxID=83341 RepID=K6WFD6_9ACTN|nr:putative ABC transporter substrate-binding protein [Gordonia rhizosphera NBRC 16068]
MKRLGTAPAVVAVVVAAMVALVAGCGSGGSDSSTTPKTSGAELNEQPRDNIRDGGTLTTALPEVSPQWNTFQADGTAYTLGLWRWYNPTLAYFAPDGTYSFNRDYLTDVQTTLEDGKTVVTYTINPKAFYNDGTPIDYRAFVNTWVASRGTDPSYVVGSSDGYDQIESVTRGVDDRQAIVRFKGVWAWPNGLFNYLLHPKVATAEQFNKAYIQQPHPEWGAGPYTVKSYDSQTGVVIFERNPKWWGNPGKLDQRIYRQLEDQASINGFRNGELDAIGVSSKENLAQVQGMQGIDIRSSASTGVSLMVVNLDAPLLGSSEVREAVLAGVDRETLAKVRFNGLDYSEQLPGSLTLFPFEPGYEDNLDGVVDFNQDKAKSLLDGQGWTPGSDGIRTKDGKRLTLTMPVTGDSPTVANIARSLQAMMKSIGVDLAVQSRSSAEFSKIVVNKEFDVFLMGFSSSDPYGMAYLCQIWCEGSQLNKAGAGSPELDAKIRAVAQISDPNEQIKEGNKVEREAFGQFSDLPLYNGPSMVAVKEKLANYGAGQFYIGPIEDIGWQK